MKLKCPDFENNGVIPKKFTCDGKNVNPGLIIESIPKAAKSLTLIIDDPDAPAGTWVHWIVYDIPPAPKIDENSVPGIQGINTSGNKNYDGARPPRGTHRYVFKIYALDAILGLSEGANKKALEKAMEGHVLDKAELTGLYTRQ